MPARRNTRSSSPPSNPALSHLEGLTPAAQLHRRLDDGYQRIDQARERGEDTTAWESFWIDLLRQYEAEAEAAGAPHYTP